MKCVKKDGVVKRVSNKDAERLVGYGEDAVKLKGEGWAYCSKDAWRKYKASKK